MNHQRAALARIAEPLGLSEAGPRLAEMAKDRIGSAISVHRNRKSNHLYTSSNAR
jgi:hypothetical protein